MTSADITTLHITGMGGGKGVEGRFVFVREVNEHPGGSILAVPHYAVESSQIETNQDNAIRENMVQY